jgi:hypothetical protein
MHSRDPQLTMLPAGTPNEKGNRRAATRLAKKKTCAGASG